ncbi:hypothetical protein FKP32DRAFT_1342335 [Trametes sanguinea]|nr:hypothetical protein FKP32DRAFT_1342335 [Trametes sanguinea]
MLCQGITPTSVFCALIPGVGGPSDHGGPYVYVPRPASAPFLAIPHRTFKRSQRASRLWRRRRSQQTSRSWTGHMP